MTYGRFVSHQLRTTDPEAARSLYGSLFGWVIEKGSFGYDIHAADRVIGQISEVKPGVPPHWTSVLPAGRARGDCSWTRAAT